MRWWKIMKGEFHIHTKYSDGVLTTQEIMSILKGNLDWFAITDHDVIDGSIEAFQEAKEYDLNALIGIEISTYLLDEPIHILGYFKNEDNVHLIKDFIEDIRNKRIQRLFKIKDLLLEHFDIDLELTELLKIKSVTRGTIATEILRQGSKYTREELFKYVIGNDCKAYVPVSRVEPKTAIDLIHKAGGIATNIGVHFYDMLQWIFGPVEQNIVHVMSFDRVAGFLQLKRARVRYFLSINAACLPANAVEGEKKTFRTLSIDGLEFEFSQGFTELHTESYRQILSGNGFRISEARPSIEIVSEIRHANPIGLIGDYHPLAKLPLASHPFGWDEKR